MKKDLQPINPKTGDLSKKTAVLKTKAYSFSGPIPHPNILKQYEKIYPGATKKIIAMAKDQSRHRQQLEKSVIGSDIFNEKLGMILAFILTIIFIIVGAVLIALDKSIAGYLSLFGPGGFHAYNYLKQKNKKDNNRSEQKEKD